MNVNTFGRTLSRIIDVFLALFLVLNCQSVYQNSVGFNFRVYEITALLIVLSFVVKFSFYKTSFYNFNRFSLFVCCYFVYLIIFILFSVQKGAIISFLGRYGLFPFVAFNFILELPQEDKFYIFKKFIDWVTIITLISLLFWSFGSTFKLISPTSLFTFKWGEVLPVNSYFGVYFETQYVDWIGIEWFYRNTAIFVEGPMFCLVLIIAIIFIVVSPIQIKNTKIKIVVLCLGLISTFSTTGLLFLGLLILCFFYKNRNLRKYLLIALPFIIIMGVFFLIKKSSTGSFFLRLDDYVAGFKTWITKPVFGFGFGNFDAVIENMSRDDNIGFSNSIFAVLVQGGLIYGLMFFIPIIYGITIGIKRKSSSLLFLSLSYVFLFVLIVFQTAFINFFIWMLIYSFPVKKRKLKRVDLVPYLPQKGGGSL